jgi:diacylglycerol kinase
MNKFFKSLSFALNGIWEVIKTQRNFRIQLILLSCAIILGFVLHITIHSWYAIIIVSGMVLISEMFNTAIEKIVDFISPEWKKKAGLIKDISAGAVFVSSLIALIIGIMIFVPRIIYLIYNFCK